MKARVIVTLKSGVLDPQGKAIEGALASLGIKGVTGVRQGKVFDVELAGAADRAAAEDALRQACGRLLANAVIENYQVEVVGDAAPPPVPAVPPPRPEIHPPPVALAAERDPAEIAARDTDIPVEGHP